jgi:methyl-accepting chemotaxis protein
MLQNLSIKHKLAISPLVALAGFGIFLACVINVSIGNSNRIDSLRDAAAPDAQLREYFDESSQLTRDIIGGTKPLAEFAARAKLAQQHQDALQQHLVEQKNIAEQRFSAVIEGSHAAARRAIYIGIGIGAVLVATLLAIGFSIATSLTRRVNAVSNSLHEIARGGGDLTRRIGAQGNDEIGELIGGFNAFIDKLHGAVAGVIAVTDPLAQAGSRLNQVAEISARNSSEQQRSTNTLMSAMSELILSVGNIAENAAATATATRDTDQESKRGTAKVADAVASINDLAHEITEAATVIGRLQKDADNVGVILDVIKNIAEQTNLLALNAAIEAARAGEQGRGFAVVADEVRTLASRTQQSTQEIQQVIQNLREASKDAVAVMTRSQERARVSVDQAEEAGNTLAAISTRVASIDDMSHQIATATEQQDHVTQSIQHSISAMSESADAVASGTREVKQLGEELHEFVAQLRKVSSQFRV